METIIPEIVADYACVIGEGPLWHNAEQRLYWVDIPPGRVYWYDPATNHHELCYEGVRTGGFTIQADGGLLLFQAGGAVRRWNAGKIVTVMDHIPGEEDTCFNDVIADPAGRVFCGTMPSEKSPGRLYRLDTDGTLTIVAEGVGCTNGMGFTPDRKRMYYTDSVRLEIEVFDYDIDSGAVTNRRSFAKLEGGGLQDGMTVDTDGCVWSAIWGRGCVIRYDVTGKEMMRLPVPASKTTSVTFGGPNYTDLYITSAGGDAKSADDPNAGATFRVRAEDLPVGGVAEICVEGRIVEIYG